MKPDGKFLEQNMKLTGNAKKPLPAKDREGLKIYMPDDDPAGL